MRGSDKKELILALAQEALETRETPIAAIVFRTRSFSIGEIVCSIAARVTGLPGWWTSVASRGPWFDGTKLSLWMYTEMKRPLD